MKETGTMLEVNKESREYDFILEVVHFGGKDDSVRLRDELSISCPVDDEFPRVTRGSIDWSFESDWEDQHESLSVDFEQFFPNGYRTRENTNCIVDGSEVKPSAQKWHFTRFVMHLTCESEYLWDEELPFEDQDYYWGVKVATWEKLEFDLGSTDIVFAFRTLIDSQ
jgi:hypothetical protein